MALEQTDEVLLKFILIGEAGVGKTQIFQVYTGAKFQDEFINTIGVDFKTKHLVVDGQKVKLQIWDTSGQEKFKAITKSYYRGAQGVFIIFDVSSQDSFKNVTKWVDSIKEQGILSVDMILIGNKIDLKRTVSAIDAQKLADTIGIKYTETSAKKNIGISEAFTYITELALKKKLEPTSKLDIATPILVEEEAKKKCC